MARTKPRLRERSALADPARNAELARTNELAERFAVMAREDLAERPVDRMLRALDLLVALTAGAVLSPVIALAAAAVLLGSGRPVLYRGYRVGRGGHVFTMYKFRTLAPGAEERLAGHYGEELTRLTRAELTGVGRVLRRTHVDELPQLWNVVRGDMSIVGPRPTRPAFFEELCLEIPQYWQRLVVRPGITGFAQLRMTREMSWAEKLSHDLEYIADRSVSLCLTVLMATARRVLARATGSDPGTV